jgi:hypothetical protein
LVKPLAKWCFRPNNGSNKRSSVLFDHASKE